MARERRYCISSATEHRLERGSMRSTPGRPKTSWWSPWPTSWLVSRGLCCPAATSTDPQQRNGAEKAPSAWKRYALPLSRTTKTARTFPLKSAKGSKDERTVTTACPQPAVTNGPQRPTSLEGTDTRATHPGQENYSPPKGRIHLRRLVFSTKLFPCSRAADHTFVTVSNWPAEIPSRFASLSL
jgi:hypothetical protein